MARRGKAPSRNQSDGSRAPSSSMPNSRVQHAEEDEARLADRLSTRLLAIDDDDEQEHERILRESLLPLQHTEAADSAKAEVAARIRRSSANLAGMDDSSSMLMMRRSTSSTRRLSRASLLISLEDMADEPKDKEYLQSKIQELLLLDDEFEWATKRRMWSMLCLAIVGLTILVIAAYIVSVRVVGPPNQPVGPYQLVELQEGSRFFDFYTFYDGKDSVGSAGFNTYVSMERAQAMGIVNVSMEVDELDLYETDSLTQTTSSSEESDRNHRRQLYKFTDNFDEMDLEPEHPRQRADNETSPNLEPFIYMGSAPTPAGPRESIRLEGIRRFNRGLFIIDVRHMPAGCGIWPAFWLVDEQNWPVNGEIDIVEGVNYQSEAKTALHSTTGCTMDGDIPYGVMTGTWDTAQGIPDAKTGIPDMTLRYAKNCFVYDPHQWLNQGCVAVSERNDTLGVPLNANGGGVFVLEWDPINRHIRSWAFTPHTEVPDNIVQSIRTAHLSDVNQRVVPDPEQWPTPYAYFAIGEGTNCPSSHFRNMRLVFNTAFCGSVAGNRFQMDCPVQAKSFKTCNDYLRSEPEELKEAYWKIRGVYVYERQWERIWLN